MDFENAFAKALTETKLVCEMTNNCPGEVTHIDMKGYIYCGHHGPDRRHYGINCRKLRTHELNRLKRGEQVKSY